MPIDTIPILPQELSEWKNGFNNIRLREYFGLAGALTTGLIGQMGWSLGVISGGVPTVVIATGTPSTSLADVAVRITTPAISLQGGILTPVLALYLPFGDVSKFMPWVACFRFRISAAITTMQTYIGFSDTPNLVVGTSFAGIRFDTNQADINFIFHFVSSGTTVSFNTGIPADTNYHTFILDNLSTAQELEGRRGLGFTLDNGNRQILTNNIFFANLIPAFTITTLAAAARTLDVNYFGFDFLSRRIG